LDSWVCIIFYLRRYGWGMCYLLTFGLFSFGWIIDFIYLPSLVENYNTAIRSGQPFIEKKTLGNALRFYFPLGFLGLHHFYLERYGWGVLYLCTFGLLGVGWLVDLFRLKSLVDQANGTTGHIPYKYSLVEGYILLVPLGFLGLHHFYLNRPQWGFFYFFTFGIFGLGWFADIFLLPSLVRQSNLKHNAHLNERTPLFNPSMNPNRDQFEVSINPTCVACLERPIDTSFNCGHACMCSVCCQLLLNKPPASCPICRSPILVSTPLIKN